MTKAMKTRILLALTTACTMLPPAVPSGHQPDGKFQLRLVKSLDPRILLVLILYVQRQSENSAIARINFLDPWKVLTVLVHNIYQLLVKSLCLLDMHTRHATCQPHF